MAMVVCVGQTTMATVWEVVQTYQSPIVGDGTRSETSIATEGNNVLVGVGYDDILMENDGAAHLFNLETGELQQTFDNPDPHVGDHFGRGVALIGGNIVIGAASSNYVPSPTPGVAYMFNPSGVLLETFSNPTPDIGDGFGYSIATVGDNVLISAPNDDTRGGNAGAAYLFDASGILLTPFFSPTANLGDYFGSCVATVGDNVLIGAGGSDEAAYLFDTSGNLLQTFENPMGAGGGLFGQNVAALGNDVLIDALDGEHAYLFDSETGDLLQTFLNPLPGETFGHGIAGVGESVFVGGPSATMHLFDASSGDLLHTFDNPGGKIGAPIVIVGNGFLTGGAETTYLFSPVPEPSTILMLVMGAVAILAYAWRRGRLIACAAVLLCGMGQAEAGDIVYQGQIFHEFNGHYYTLITDPQMHWTEAETLAVDIGGHLVSINDQAEQDFINETFLSDDPALITAWIGLTDEAEEGTFVWTTGEPLLYQNWETGDPNDLWDIEDYGAVNWGHYYDDLEIGTWHDLSNDPHLSSIIELNSNPIPEPSTLALLGMAVVGFLACTWRNRRRR